MKKKILLFLMLALTLLLVLPGTAHAEDSVMLGSFSAGTELEVPILWTDVETEVFTNGLPPGLYIERVEFDDSCLLNLRGTPLHAGEMRFTVEAGEVINCVMTILPAVPTVAIPADVSCSVGEEVEIRVSASVPDEGSLSYQWYIARGALSERIEGAAGFILRPDTSEPGISWYCCEVVNTNNGLTASAMSEYVGVEVSARAIQSVSVESMPARTSYQPGDRIDTSGLRILVRYEGGYNEIIDEGFTVSPSFFDEAGTHSVTVGFEGFSCTFPVTVRTPEESVTRISVLTLPRKTEYTPGENLQTDGLSIRCFTEDGRFFDVSSDFDCLPERLLTEGEQTVTVRYAGKTCSFTVRVKEDKVITGISVLTMPSVRSYTVGDRLDTEGLTIQVNSNKGSEILQDGFTVTPKVLATPGTQEITVLYGQYATRFNVTVKAREAVTPNPRSTPTPAPSGSPESSPGADTSPAPGQTAQPVQTPPVRKNTGVNTGVKIIFCIAVLALAGLAAYVWYLRRQGFDGEDPDAPDVPEKMNTVSGEAFDDGKQSPDSK